MSDNPSLYSVAILTAFNNLNKNVYGGTVPYEVIQKRRNRATKASRKINQED